MLYSIPMYFRHFFRTIQRFQFLASRLTSPLRLAGVSPAGLHLYPPFDIPLIEMQMLICQKHGQFNWLW